MRRSIWFILIICIIPACTKYHDPAYELLDHYSFGYQVNQQQKFLAGEEAGDSIPFWVAHTTANTAESLKVIFEVESGGGSVSHTVTYTNSNGIAYTKWTLGTDSFSQILRASIFDSKENFISYADLTAYGFSTNEWDAISNSPDGNIIDMATDTINHITIMISSGMLYRQTENYFDWEVINMSNSSFNCINVDHNGVFYASSWSGDLFKSIDKGITWNVCTKPFPDLNYYLKTYVANDNYIWAFAYDHPVRFSDDGGTSWTDAGGSISNFGFGDIFRLKDGSMLFHGSDCCSLYRSFDNGATWSSITTPGMSVKLYVDNMDNIYIVTQENGYTIYRSTDYGIIFDKVYTVYPQWGTAFNNTFNKWGNSYYIVIPGYGILKSSDLVHYQTYWENENLIDLFIDRSGVLIARDRNMSTVYYRKNTD